MLAEGAGCVKLDCGEGKIAVKSRISNQQSPIHLGTCAWTHDDWRGSFYPADLPADRWLAWYARVFNAVEIDSTFYASPPAHTVARWLSEAPPHFRFASKAPRTITHQLRLRHCGAPLAGFLEAIRPLHGHLGPILFQLPPSFGPAQDATALRDFILALPHGWKFAIEFRHPDWHRPHFVKLLEDHGVCWAWSDMTSVADQDQAPFGLLPETADFLYLRLMGDWQTKFGEGGKHLFRYNGLRWSRAEAIESWAVRLHKQAGQVKAIYVFCNNHYEGFAPVTCRQLAERLGIELTLPPTAEAEPGAKGPRQMKLL
jgi:uncharacterized protein YecE (DUF72 family)